MSAALTAAQRPVPPCAECGAPVRGAFCAACGQKAEALRLPAHDVAREAFVEFFGLDGRVWRTFAALVFRPGRLTVSFMRGQRQRYLRPLRVYLTSTLLFFLLLSVVDPVGRLGLGDSDRTPADRVRVAAHLAETDAVIAGGIGVPLLEEEGLDLDSAAAGAPDRDSLATARADSSSVADALLTLRRARAEAAILRSMPPDSLIYPSDLSDVAAVLYPDTTSGIDGPSWILRSKAVRALAVEQTEASRRSALTDYLRASVGKIPTVMFLLLPLFALLLKGLYARRGWFFAEHIVFGLHTHAFAFVAFTGITLAVWAAPKPVAQVVVLALLVAIPVYFLAAMKRVYGQGWGKTLAKATVLAFVYNTVLLFGLVAASLLAAVLG